MSKRKKDGSGLNEAGDTQEPLENVEKVEETSDENADQDFPGYPHYPPTEDILNPSNFSERVDVDVENITRSTNRVRIQEKDELTTSQAKRSSGYEPQTEDDDLAIVPGTDADVTEDDLLILETTDGNIVRAKEEDLTTTDSLSDINVEDFDLPGTELDDANEDIGEEDEENNYYSLGGEKEDLLEDDQQS